jgi:hypothetical protein
MTLYFARMRKSVKRFFVVGVVLSVFAITSACLDRLFGISLGFSEDALEEAVIGLASLVCIYVIARFTINFVGSFYEN